MKIKCLAIIGLGSIGRRHLRLISEIRPDIETVVVRSGNGEPSEEEKLASLIVGSIDDAIKYGIQAAIISSPATLHLKQSLELAKKEIPLLIEKPISHTSEKTDKLLNIVNDKGLIVMIGYVLRYDLGAIKFKNWLSKKITGNILHATIECGSYLPDWRPDQDYRKTVSSRKRLGGGVLLELSHEIDYLHWFFGKPVDVQAQIRNSGTLDIDVEDQAHLLLTSKQGYPIALQVDFNRRFVERKCKVITTDGELVWDAVNKNVTWKTVYEDSSCYEYDSERDDIYRMQLKNFVNCVENNIAPPVTAEDGVNVISLIDAARSASIKGCKISL